MERKGKSTQCHFCRSEDLHLVIDLGLHGPGDLFLNKEELETEVLYPLQLVTCGDCGLLQINYYVDPAEMYQKSYLYESSTTKTFRDYFSGLAKETVERFSIPKDSLAVDIGSNVGVLLQGFKDAGMRVMGVDAAPNIAQKAEAAGIPTINDFFSEKVVDTIIEREGKAAVIAATNCFAHIHNIDEAVQGIKRLLDKNGVIVIEAQYGLTIIEDGIYDTVYLEHIGSLSVKPMQTYLKKFDLEVFDVMTTKSHGGSLRYYVGHTGEHKVSPNVADFIRKEEEAGMYDLTQLAKFREGVETQKKELMDILHKIKSEGKSIVGLSAPAKGNTLLTYCGIDTSILDYVTERNVSKIGKYTPAMHIPIRPDEKLLEDQPDYVLLLAWNFADEIIKNTSAYQETGGKYIVPMPKPRIV